MPLPANTNVRAAPPGLRVLIGRPFQGTSLSTVMTSARAGRAPAGSVAMSASAAGSRMVRAAPALQEVVQLGEAPGTARRIEGRVELLVADGGSGVGSDVLGGSAVLQPARRTALAVRIGEAPMRVMTG